MVEGRGVSQFNEFIKKRTVSAANLEKCQKTLPRRLIRRGYWYEIDIIEIEINNFDDNIVVVARSHATSLVGFSPANWHGSVLVVVVVS